MLSFLGYLFPHPHAKKLGLKSYPKWQNITQSGNPAYGNISPTESDSKKPKSHLGQSGNTN
jgi:hypothetical protein